MIDSYLHHGIYVFVQKELRGKHKEYCLCFKCDSFDKDREKNCRIANLVFALNQAFGLVTPVWECPDFNEK